MTASNDELPLYRQMIMKFGKELGLDGKIPCWLHEDINGQPAPNSDRAWLIRQWRETAQNAGLPLVIIQVRHHAGCEVLDARRHWGRQCTCGTTRFDIVERCTPAADSDS